MKIMIDIPDRIHEILKNRNLTTADIEIVERAIRKGVPLPKGHGRIADMDSAIKCIEEVEGEDAIWAISLIEWACIKRTLIEADTESRDKE